MMASTNSPTAQDKNWNSCSLKTDVRLGWKDKLETYLGLVCFLEVNIALESLL